MPPIFHFDIATFYMTAICGYLALVICFFGSVK